MRAKVFFYCFFLLVFLSKTAHADFLYNTKGDTSILRFLHEFQLPYHLQFKDEPVGGLSGIDYDADHDLYYVISDYRAENNICSKFYIAKILLQDNTIDTVIFTGRSEIARPENNVDPESIRYNKKTNQIFWTSEGERIISKGKKIIADPSINITNIKGAFLSELNIPENTRFHTTEKGPRRNGTFEGSTFSHDFSRYLVSIEEPLYEDGPEASLDPSTSWIRILNYNTETTKCESQYAYKLEPVAFPPIPDDEFKINGVSEILLLDNNTLLVIERSFSTGRPGCTIKVFEAYLSSAEDISGMSSLKDSHFKEMKKKLLLDMDTLNRKIDNIEGVTFGPTLPNGNRSLIFVSDNNFQEAQLTQFLLFELIR